MTTLKQLHSGHNHHHHNHDNTYLKSTSKNDAGAWITRVGLYVNLGMAISKGIGGYVFHSQALSADAVHSLTDLVSDFMTLATVAWSLKLPAAQFPLGFGKIESLGSLGVSGLLLVGGLLMGWRSLLDLMTIYAPGLAGVLEMIGVIGCKHTHKHQIPNIQAGWLAGGSVLVKEWLYRATLKVAKERKSAVLEANAVHHRVDSLTGVAALVSIAVSNLFPTFVGMDALGGLVISYMVIRAGWSNSFTSLYELADASVANDIKTKVRHEASAAVADSTQSSAKIVKVNGIKAGQTYLVDITVAVQGDLSIYASVAVENMIRKRVAQKVRGVRRVRIFFIVANEEKGYDSQDEFVEPSNVSSMPELKEHGQHHHWN